MTGDRVDVAFSLAAVSISYGPQLVLDAVSMKIPKGGITSFIGPNGSGKTSLLRCLNRMNDLVANIRVRGRIEYQGEDLNAPDADVEAIRRRIGMVFQRPNVFPRSVYDNIAYGPRLRGRTTDLDTLVEHCLRQAGLWAEVRSQLSRPAHELSGGQQQRLVIARALAVQSEVLLMDEPCAALDPAASLAIEQLMVELAQERTVVLVTHDLAQARRVSGHVAFLQAEQVGQEQRHGHLVEFGDADQVFNDPIDERTRAYLTSR